MADSKQVKVSKAKGRPMLTWVGKKPLTQVRAYPAQKVEAFNIGDDVPLAKTDWSDWPEKFGQGGLLFHGDNKDVLAYLLANGFRGKIKLIYIDPPFDSGADYVRKVQLRGVSGTQKIDGEEYALGEQIQYTDIWANDNYLQFMYERLLMLKELLSEEGIIWLHANSLKGAHLKILLDEVFGHNNFINEVTWHYYNKMAPDSKCFPRASDRIHVYAKSLGNHTFTKQLEKREKAKKQLARKFVDGKAINVRDEEGNVVYTESTHRRIDDVWRLSMLQPADKVENTPYPTQKPERLLERVIASTSMETDIVLDCFIGSGTTAAVSQKLGRRWIGCDINKGAIQTTSSRLQKIMSEQAQKLQSDKQGDFVGSEDAPSSPSQLGFSVWRVNDYDLQIQHNEALDLACEYMGVTRTRTDSFFEGTRGKNLVKIIPFNHPLTPLDLESIKEELERRPEEERDIDVVALGMELTARAWLETYNRNRPLNRFNLFELRTDAKYGGFIKHEPLTASFFIEHKGDKLHIEITDVFSPSIVKRLNLEQGLFRAQIDDWRAVVDCILIDTSYNGELFNVALTDVPEKKNDLVQGAYELPAPPPGSRVAIKIIDMLGEELILTQEV